jgi:hypothetical protein
VATLIQSQRGVSDQRIYPDGRQTRIDFSPPGRRTKSQLHTSGRATFDWWHAITGWLRSSAQQQEHQLAEFKKFLEGRNYSPKSCRSYLFMLKKFFNYLDEKGVRQITTEDIEDYNYEFFVIGRYSRSYQLQFINALTLYLEFARGVKVNLKGLRKSESRR